MLTKESEKLIDEVIQKSKKNDLLQDTYLKKLFHYFESVPFDYEKPRKKNSKGVFPSTEFMTDSLTKKSKTYNYVSSATWLVQGRFQVKCSLNIYSKTRYVSDATLNLFVYALSFVASLSNKNRTIKVHLVLLPDKKLYKGKFTKNHINGGSCIFNDTESNVYVWRKEECIKVLFHECIHALCFSSLDQNDRLVQKYQREYNIRSSKLKIEETYTEIWAKIINCYFLSKLFHIQNPEKDNYEYFCLLLGIEREFCFQQASKIKSFLKQQEKPFDLNKDTNVSAYYLGTAEIFQNLNHFLKMISKNRIPFYLEKKEQFKNFLVECKSIPRRKVNTASNVYKTFRMSATELMVT